MTHRVIFDRLTALAGLMLSRGSMPLIELLLAGFSESQRQPEVYCVETEKNPWQATAAHAGQHMNVNAKWLRKEHINY
jgi:hypothetical protein